MGEDKILTLLFVLSGRIFYTKPSDDPIFPMTKNTGKMNNKTIEYYANTMDHARPLACVDFTGWRDRSKGLDWHPIKEEPPMEIDGKFPKVLWLLYISLLNSNTYQSISDIRGLRLNAASKIR